MWTRGYVLQQMLRGGGEAAGVVTQAVSLARRRGHAQVTPLHIASAMLSAGGGLLHAACVQSQSHPLQYNALVLCFDVALDRFAMAGPAAGAVIRHSDLHVPALSNAFVAALKRAQALHKRRGSVDGQSQRLAAKLSELEQLIVSILDDPSVDRVMSEAGFSSSQVKANIVSEQPNRTSSDTTAPNPVYQKIRAGQGQPSLEAVLELHPAVVDIPDASLALSLSCNSESEAIQAKSRTGRPVLFDGTEVVTTTPILPSWLRRYQDTFPTRSTRWSTSLQVQTTCRQQKFTELTAENLKILCDALELRVPRHKDIVPGISSTVLRCRSGMMRRVRKPNSSTTWLLFRGRDDSGKKAMAQELAKLVFGSYTEFTALQVNTNPTPSGKITRKRQIRDNDNGNVGMRFFEATLENPHRVILINGIDQLDHDSAIRAENAVASGTMKGCNGDVVSLEDAIVVLSSEVSESSFLVCSPRVKQRISKLNHEEGDTTEKEVKSPRFSLDLNACTKDGEDDEDNLVGHVGIMNIVDGVFFFD